MRSEKVADICNTIKELDPSQDDYQNAKSDLKKKLPAITVHSCYFFDSKRSNDSAWYNGLAALEYDHLSEDEIEAFKHVVPTDNVVLAGLSCSGTGVWFLLEVPGCDYSLMESTIRDTHRLFCTQIKVQAGLDVTDKVDIQLDTARLRFLPPYSYIWYDNVSDFACEKERSLGLRSQWGKVLDACAKLESQVPEG